MLICCKDARATCQIIRGRRNEQHRCQLLYRGFARVTPELGSGNSTGAQPAGVAIVGEQLAVAHPGGVAPGTFWLGQGSETN
jgi:hypothetical protein